MRAPPRVREYKNDGGSQDRHRLRTSLQLCAPPTKRTRNQSRPGAAYTRAEPLTVSEQALPHDKRMPNALVAVRKSVHAIRTRNRSRPGAATLDHHTGARERVPKSAVVGSSTTTRKQEHARKPSASVPGTCSNRDRCEMRCCRAVAAWRVRVLRRLEAPQRSVSLHHDERIATEPARFVRELKKNRYTGHELRKNAAAAWAG